MASDDEGPICLDTGWPTFDIKTPIGANQIAMKKEIREAIAEATKRGKLRPNSVDSISGKNSAAQYYAKCIDEALDVKLLDFGVSETMWHLHATDFPAIVTMDIHGNSLHADVEKDSVAILAKLAEPVFSMSR